MADSTKIEWADSTLNYWGGCTKVSPACDNCYAETATPIRVNGVKWGPGEDRLPFKNAVVNARRWNARPFYECGGCGWRGDATDARIVDGGDVQYVMCGACNNSDLKRARRRVFSLSLGDWLDNEVPIELFVEMLDSVRVNTNLDFLLLTKRIGNWRSRLQQAAIYAQDRGSDSSRHLDLYCWIDDWLSGKAPANVWLGITVIDQAEADRDVPKLLQVPARIRFLSIEPMLRAINIGRFVRQPAPGTYLPAVRGLRIRDSEAGRGGIDWIICGGESGPNARPMHPDWVRSLRDQCAAASVPFLFKQWGCWTPGENVEAIAGRVETATWFDGNWRFASESLSYTEGYADDQPDLYRIGKTAAGNHLDGRQHLAWPEATNA